MRKLNTDPLMEPRRKQKTWAERGDLHRIKKSRSSEVDTLADTAPFSLPRGRQKTAGRDAKAVAEN
jgi:hypothetical protein